MGGCCIFEQNMQEITMREWKVMFLTSTEIKPRQYNSDNIDDSATCHNIKVDHPQNTYKLWCKQAIIDWLHKDVLFDKVPSEFDF
jgi:hypothetical protein